MGARKSTPAKIVDKLNKETRHPMIKAALADFAERKVCSLAFRPHPRGTWPRASSQGRDKKG
jgi:hypothetical protein